jgi:hypothetical protein
MNWMLMAAATLAVSSAVCAIVGPTCLERQERGSVTALNGHVEAGEVNTHLMPYERRGSQNDVDISWSGQSLAGGPRLRIYATGTDCAAFIPPAVGDSNADRGACTIIGSGGGGYLVGNELVHTSLIVTGPGNGAPLDFHEYKLHVVGDATRTVDYSVSVTWFFGPDC